MKTCGTTSLPMACSTDSELSWRRATTCVENQILTRKAAEQLGVEPALCLALEDSYNGVRAAFRAGMMTIMVPDLLAPTTEMEELCVCVAQNLHQVCRLMKT